MDKRLLLVLDLNGTIVLRSNSGSTVFCRPYLRTFLHYLSVASGDPKISGLSATEVVIWSSAQPQSVEKIVKDVFGPSSLLLAIWDRTHLGLSKEDYNRKVQVTKDLRKLWAAFPHHSSATTILLDDSAKKAQLQPYNHLCISEYSRIMHKGTKAALEAVQAGVESPTQLDQGLVAVIGVLESLRKEPDIASWMRRGSLSNVALSCPSHAAAPAITKPRAANLASWWEEPDTMRFWIRTGRLVLRELEIDLEID